MNAVTASSVLPDVLAPHLAVVFCGTAVGSASARRGAYYAGPGNRFWPTLFKVGLTSLLLRPEEFTKLPRFGLGLTDLAKIVSGSDASLAREQFDCERLRTSILAFGPRLLGFNGKRAAEVFLGRSVAYGAQPEAIGPTQIFVLPSTSGAARGFWDVDVWHDLARFALAGPPPPIRAHG